MTFIPPGEKIIETRICPLTGSEFVITEEDRKMYDILSPVIGGQKLLIPFPTLCPQERQIRRMVWRNYDQFYKNSCALTGKEVITTYKPGTPYKVTNLESWWSDNWNPNEYALKVDFSRPFFDQFYELDQLTLHMPLSISKSENSAFTNFSIQNRDCYLCSRIVECENCYYSLLIVRSKNCFDCYDIADSEYLYECIRTTQSYSSFYCTDCENCHDSYFLKDCSGCRDCFGSCNLRNAQFVFYNKQLPEIEYRKNITQILEIQTDGGEIRNKFLHFCEQFPKKYITGFGNEDVSGNFLFSNAHIVFGFDCRECENVRYAYGGHNARDSIDISTGYFHQKSLEVCGGTTAYNELFCINCLNDCRDLFYCKDCVNVTSNCFGCISLKKSKHCILNKAYSQEEYEKLVLKLIDHMKATREWGEFFPVEYSPYAYNETTAHAHFPHEKDWVENRGWKWYNADFSTQNTDSFTPLPISQYTEKIVGYEVAKKNIDTLLLETLYCVESGKPYRILGPELAFYIENGLQVPQKHPSVRSENRMKQMLPMELYDRSCDKCGKALFTAYAPDRPEKVLCEECYRKLVY